MNIYILAPAGVISGGPELAHQFCGVCNRFLADETEAKVCYVDASNPNYIDAIGVENEIPERYRIYVTKRAHGLEEIDQPGNVVVVPEGLSYSISVIKKARIFFWWMSVDNYTESTGEENLDSIIERSEYHLVQSEYARNYIYNKNVSQDKILWLTDYINDMHGQFLYPVELRRDVALYNPKKGYGELQPLMQYANWIKWIPLVNLTLEEEVILMQSSKIYVDFGEHPGRDRIPREAAANGCCVITNRRGSAGNDIDVPISSIYKYENPSQSMEEINLLLHDICENFKQHQDDFAEYRKIIKEQKTVFESEIKEVLKKIKD
ncbi:MAG: hypothetical protein II169_05500 [Lachnospiraceae bacterium]|nr:hypothetical protein [Lachnospiraceae bacterium]